MIFINLSTAFIAHFISDFLLQSRDIAKNKSSKYKALFIHVTIITIVMYALLKIVGYEHAFMFSILNGLVHGIIDKFIWNGYKYYVIKTSNSLEEANNHKYYEDHWFYATIGLDQLLHSLTIVILMSIL